MPAASYEGMSGQNNEGADQMRTMSIFEFKGLATAVLLALPLAVGLAGTGEAAGKITVTGEGRVAAAPDMATIMLGVTTQADTADAALSDNSARVAEIMARLKEAGIADRDVQTSGLSLNPQFSYDSSGSDATPDILGFIASNNVTVRVRALDGLGSVLDTVVKNGANTLNGLTFGLTAPEPVLDEARKLAVLEARRKAELYAAAAGLSLGPVLTIAESSGYSEPMPMFRADAAMSAGAVPVASGELGVSAMVTIEFELSQ